MLIIQLSKIGRRFNRDWIFRHLSLELKQGQSIAVLGANGSGKSTFLQLLAGSLSPSEGTISYQYQGKMIDESQVFSLLSFASPYLELIEEFTLLETLEFHFRFKKLKDGLTISDLLDLLNMGEVKNRPVKYFSSGMKQRVKVILACCSDTPILILDEPTANLDAQGEQWYLHLIQRFAQNRLVIIGSNQPHEYAFCSTQVYITDYKKHSVF